MKIPLKKSSSSSSFFFFFVAFLPSRFLPPPPPTHTHYSDDGYLIGSQSPPQNCVVYLEYVQDPYRNRYVHVGSQSGDTSKYHLVLKVLNLFPKVKTIPNNKSKQNWGRLRFLDLGVFARPASTLASRS